MDILRKEYCTRRWRALEAFPTRAKSRGRPVTSDRPPPRRCGQAAWAAAGRPIFATGVKMPHPNEIYGISISLLLLPSRPRERGGVVKTFAYGPFQNASY